MKKLLPWFAALAVGAAVGYSLAAEAAELLDTSITSTTGASANAVVSPGPVIIWCDANSFIVWGSDNTVSVSSTTGIYLPQNTPFSSAATIKWRYLAAAGAAGATAHCYVFKVVDTELARPWRR